MTSEVLMIRGTFEVLESPQKPGHPATIVEFEVYKCCSEMLCNLSIQDRISTMS